MPHIVDKSKEQREAEAEVEAFKSDLGPFVVAAETTRMAMLFTDAKTKGNPVVFANDSFLALTGYDREEVLGQNFSTLFENGSDSPAAVRICAEFTGRASAETEVLYHRKGGAPFWVAVFITPVVDANGAVVQHFASFIDLSLHKEQEAHSKMLIDELNHRVKNTLATVRSIVSQGLRTSTSVEVVRESVESRLFALSRSHDLLARENWNNAGLLDLVNEALEPFGGKDDTKGQFRITGENIRLKPNAALALGIAFHELATNAVKYGALSKAAGFVLISWIVQDSIGGKRLRLRWQERGGPVVAPPIHKGFGSRVIERGLTHELMAETRLDYQPTGLSCTIDMPAPNDMSEIESNLIPHSE